GRHPSTRVSDPLAGEGRLRPGSGPGPVVRSARPRGPGCGPRRAVPARRRARHGGPAPRRAPTAADPPVVRAGRLPSDRSGHRVLGRAGVRRGGRGAPHQLEGVRAPRAALHERVRGGALGGRGHRGRRAARVVRGHGGGQSGRTRGPGSPRDRGPRPRDEEPGRPDCIPPGDRLGPARLRTEAALSDLGPPGPREAGRGVARLPRGSRPLAVLPAGLPHGPDHAAAGPGRPHGGDRTRPSRGAHRRWARWSGLLALGTTYVVSHAFVLGIQVLPALVFVSLLIAQVELRILAERFAPLFLTTITSAQQRQIQLALLRALVRLTIASILAVVIPLLAADLASAGVVPVTTIPTALLLSAALVAVVLILALLPSLESKVEWGQRGVLGTADSSPSE